MENMPAGRLSYAQMERRANLATADAHVRQAVALERIADALDRLANHFCEPATSAAVAANGER